MIYITGDCHGDYRRFSTGIFPEQKEMTKDDYVIVCGDFGFWNPSKKQDYWLKWLTEKPFTTLFVDGNHECFDNLYALPVEVWNQGKIHRVTDSIYHLMRGQVFDIAGLKIFTFGGAASHDIQGGILDIDDPEYKEKKRKLDKGDLPYRINHISWWKEEMPCDEEYAEGLANLEKNNWTVDYIISHCCASSTQALLSDGFYTPDKLTGYFEEVKARCTFKKWFFGHYHCNKNVTDKEIALYEQIIRIA